MKTPFEMYCLIEEQHHLWPVKFDRLISTCLCLFEAFLSRSWFAWYVDREPVDVETKKKKIDNDTEK